MKRIKNTIILAIFGLPVVCQAQGRVDIVVIYDNFLNSRIAAQECKAIDKATELKFLTNLNTVQLRALMAIKERNKTRSEKQLADDVKAAFESKAARLKSEIATQGCSSPKIQQLLRLYKLHSEMNLYGQT